MAVESMGGEEGFEKEEVVAEDGVDSVLSHRVSRRNLLKGVAGVAGAAALAGVTRYDSDTAPAIEPDEAVTEALQSEVIDPESWRQKVATAEVSEELAMDRLVEKIKPLPEIDEKYIHDLYAPGTPRTESSLPELALEYVVDTDGYVHVTYQFDGRRCDKFVFYLRPGDYEANLGLLKDAQNGELDLRQEHDLQSLFHDGVFDGQLVRALEERPDAPGKYWSLATSDPGKEHLSGVRELEPAADQPAPVEVSQEAERKITDKPLGFPGRIPPSSGPGGPGGLSWPEAAAAAGGTAYLAEKGLRGWWNKIRGREQKVPHDMVKNSDLPQDPNTKMALEVVSSEPAVSEQVESLENVQSRPVDGLSQNDQGAKESENVQSPPTEKVAQKDPRSSWPDGYQD